MTITASQIMTMAGILLQDQSAIRWTYPELADWISEAVNAIVLADPSASSANITLTLQAGTWQQLPDGCISLLRLTRNLTAVGPPRVGGRAIRPTTRDVLDAVSPHWHSPKAAPYRPEVRQFIYDEEDPTSFYVYPGNDGTGIVEAIVSEQPTPIAADGSPTALGSYGQDIGLPDIYQTPVLNYVVYRCFSKDDTGGNPEMATAYFQSFTAALAGMLKGEQATSPNAKTGTSPT